MPEIIDKLVDGLVMLLICGGLSFLAGGLLIFVFTANTIKEAHSFILYGFLSVLIGIVLIIIFGLISDYIENKKEGFD